MGQLKDYGTKKEFEQVGTNLWKNGNKHYRLFGLDVTPNGCWRVAPGMIGLADIDAATGEDVYTGEVIHFSDVTGTVSPYYQCLDRATLNF